MNKLKYATWGPTDQAETGGFSLASIPEVMIYLIVQRWNIGEAADAGSGGAFIGITRANHKI